MDLQGKRAVVTGGAVRVGRAISLALAAAGCDLLIHYGRSAGPAEATGEEAASAGAKIALHAADLSDADAVRSIIPAGIEALGGIDLLINSAAIFPDGSLLDTTLEGWQQVFDVNLRAPFLLSQDFARHRQETAPGTGSDTAAIINILDARIFRPAADHFAYRLTKSALHALTEGVAHELAPDVRVNAVALGAILPPPGEAPEYLENLAQSRVPLRRPGSAEAVAENVVHLLRQPFLTGVTIRLDGGEFL